MSLGFPDPSLTPAHTGPAREVADFGAVHLEVTDLADQPRSGPMSSGSSSAPKPPTRSNSAQRDRPSSPCTPAHAPRSCKGTVAFIISHCTHRPRPTLHGSCCA